MANTVKCDIVSTEESIYSGEAVRLVANGVMGELGIEPGHAALLTPLLPGPVRIVKADDSQEIVYLSGGYMEVQPNAITVLADTAVRADNLDEAAALEAKKAAEDMIENQSGEMDYSLALTQLAEAAAQLRTIQQIKEKLGKH